MHRLGCLGLMLAFYLLAKGGQDVYEGIQNRQPQAMTFQQFEQAKPSGGWFKISHCEIDVADAMWMEEYGSLTKVFVPVRLAGDDDENKPVSLLLQVEDPHIRDVVGDIKSMQEQSKNDDKKLHDYVIAHADDMFIERDVQGMLAFGVNDMESDDRDKIKKLDDRLAPDFTVLIEGAKPNMFFGFIMLVGGLLLLGFIMTFAIREQAEKNAQTKGKAAGPPAGNPPDGTPPLPWNGTPAP